MTAGSSALANIIVFNVVLLVTCIYAGARGGAPERIAAGLFIGASAVTYVLPFDPDINFHHVEWANLAIDVVMLLSLGGLALAADRFWPMWLAALQLLMVAVHGVRAYEPRLLALTYSLVAAKLAYGALVILAVAVLRHRARTAGGRREHDWTHQRHRARGVPGSAPRQGSGSD